MTDQSDRFLRRRAVSQAVGKPEARIHLVPNAEDVAALLASPLDAGRAGASFEQLKSGRRVDTAVPEVSEAEAAALLTEIGANFDRTRFDRFMGDMRDSTLSAVAGPLGLGYVLSGLKAFDDGRPGGTVTHYQPGTRGMSVSFVLSAPGRDEEKDVCPAAGATGEELQALVSAGYASRPEIFHSPNLKDYRITNAWDRVEYEAKTGRSEATREEVRSPANLRRLRREIGGSEYVITCGDRADEAVGALSLPAARMRNHHPSLRAMNNLVKSDRATRQERRKDRTEQWVDQTLASVTGPTPTVIERARAQTTFAVESGYKMGKQQVIGAVLTEFSVAMSSEIAGCFRHGIREADEHLFAALARRAKRVGMQVLGKWKIILEAGIFGLVSGIVAETAAIFVNMIAGIAARFVRIVRQSLVSILRAIKLVLFPPPDADPAQISHEASKLLAAGVVVACGVLLEEFVSKAFFGMDLVSSVVVSLLTGLATALVMYGLDRLDMFGAIAGQRQKFLFAELDARIAQALQISADALTTFATPVGPLRET